MSQQRVKSSKSKKAFALDQFETIPSLIFASSPEIEFIINGPSEKELIVLEIPHGREQFIIFGSLNQQTLANCHDILTFRREATNFQSSRS